MISNILNSLLYCKLESVQTTQLIRDTVKQYFQEEIKQSEAVFEHLQHLRSVKSVSEWKLELNVTY